MTAKITGPWCSACGTNPAVNGGLCIICESKQHGVSGIGRSNPPSNYDSIAGLDFTPDPDVSTPRCTALLSKDGNTMQFVIERGDPWTETDLDDVIAYLQSRYRR